MEVYTARQPNFNRNLSIYGYELLYINSMNNYYDDNDDISTAEVVVNSFLVMKFNELTDETIAFNNFSNVLLTKEIPFLLQNENMVIEILERVEMSDELINTLKKLKKNGYFLALEDFVLNQRYLPLIELADIIKIVFNNIEIGLQRKFIRKYENEIFG